MQQAISANKLAVARGRLIAAVGHDVTWKLFAEWAGLSDGTISGIRNGRSGGSSHTLSSVVRMLREKGVPILAEDLLENVLVASPEA